jgi:hypothetical protein
VVHVANDDGAVLRIGDANDADAGRIAIRARPGVRRVGWLSRDLLAGLGVDFTVSGAGRNDDENLQLLPVRLAASRISDILVDDVELIPSPMVGDLAVLAAGAGIRLWLVTRPPVNQETMAALADWCAAEVGMAAVAAWWPYLLDQRPGGKTRQHRSCGQRRTLAAAARRRDDAAGHLPRGASAGRSQLGAASAPQRDT